MRTGGRRYPGLACRHRIGRDGLEKERERSARARPPAAYILIDDLKISWEESARACTAKLSLLAMLAYRYKYRVCCKF